MARLRRATFAVPIFIAVYFSGGLRAADRAELDLERSFERTVRPFVLTYCITCHGKEKPRADFDLSPYLTTGTVGALLTGVLACKHVYTPRTGLAQKFSDI